MISMSTLNLNVLTAAFALIGEKYDTPDARRFLLAWAWQETKLAAMRQYGGGPAASFWQFERPTIRLVLGNPQVAALAAAACKSCGVKADSLAIWTHFQTLDGQTLAAAFARLLLLCDAHPVPTTMGGERKNAKGETERFGAWKTYASDVVRPGKPHVAQWPESWRRASDAVGLTP